MMVYMTMYVCIRDDQVYMYCIRDDQADGVHVHVHVLMVYTCTYIRDDQADWCTCTPSA